MFKEFTVNGSLHIRAGTGLLDCSDTTSSQKTGVPLAPPPKNPLHPSPTPKTKGWQRNFDASGVADIHGRRYSLTIRQNVCSFTLYYIKKTRFTHYYHILILFLFILLRANLMQTISYFLQTSSTVTSVNVQV